MLSHIGPEMIALALGTPVWFAARLIRHHVKQHRAVNAWERHLNR